jgi:hypothetical protein
VKFASEEASSRIVLGDGTVLTRCDQCRTMYAERKPPGTPPCESCRVDLREENDDAARIFNCVQGQVITRNNGRYDVVTDINHLTIWAAIDAYGIRDRVGTFEKVCSLFHVLLKEKRDEE